MKKLILSLSILLFSSVCFANEITFNNMLMQKCYPKSPVNDECDYREPGRSDLTLVFVTKKCAPNSYWMSNSECKKIHIGQTKTAIVPVPTDDPFMLRVETYSPRLNVTTPCSSDFSKDYHNFSFDTDSARSNFVCSRS